MSAVRQRCAIYTRKSSEEGLEQGFNSLHAQREACSAYVLSQAGEGWAEISNIYDDGGFSGGSMDRPGLRALLDDIDRGLIDVVVVYKVDRLTRSLIDFAKIVERFDAKGVSFVSVTQAFNTTNSMGRLTLNVLLSFAQFEREVTAERIRDKIAASKAKGMWMGGRLPLGYAVADHRLVIDPVEALTVRSIFRRFLELKSVRELQVDLEQSGVRSRSWIDGEGRQKGNTILTRGQLYYLLSNPAYRGAIRHKEKVYDNAHPAIVDDDLWAKVQAKLMANGAPSPSSPRANAPVLLKGLLFDDRGNPMVATHTAKGTARYRYYVSMALQVGKRASAGNVPRIAMAALEKTIENGLTPLIADDVPRDTFANQVRATVRRVTLFSDRIEIEANSAHITRDFSVSQAAVRVTGEIALITIAVRLRRRQGTVIMEGPGPVSLPGRLDRALVRAVVLARQWARLLEEGAVGSTKELARRQGLCEHYTARLIPLAYLAPDLTAAILEGRQSAALTLKTIIQSPLPLAWADQRRVFSLQEAA